MTDTAKKAFQGEEAEEEEVRRRLSKWQNIYVSAMEMTDKISVDSSDMEMAKYDKD